MARIFCPRRYSAMQVASSEEEEDFNPSYLRIKIPRRQRWAPHDDEAIRESTDKLRDHLDSFELIEDRDDKILAFISLLSCFCQQPALLAAFPLLRQRAIEKVESIGRDIANTYTPHEQEYLEASSGFGELISEIHDHPIYREE